MASKKNLVVVFFGDVLAKRKKGMTAAIPFFFFEKHAMFLLQCYILCVTRYKNIENVML